MRLVFLAQAFLPVVGGAERFLDQLARRLQDRGHDVCVVAARKRHAPQPDLPYPLYSYRKLPARLRGRFAQYPGLHLWRAHRRGRPDCVHAHGAYPPGWAARGYCARQDVPLVVRPIGFDLLPGESIRSDPRSAARLRTTLQGCDRVVAQSLDMARLIAEQGVPSERIERIPNGVDCAPREPDPAARAAQPVIAALGSLSAKKGFDVLLRAFAELHAERPTARLVIGGEGPERPALERLAAEAGLSERVSLPGNLDEAAKRALLARAWVFVSSSRREPFSNANLEGLAAGLPLVATAVGGNVEMVTAGENGFLVPSEDAHALGAALREVLGDDARRARMGSASRAVAQRFSWDETVARYERLYEDVVAARVARRA